MDQILARRNGQYSCLDCQNQCTDLCASCKNWGQFKLDVEKQYYRYDVKNEMYERKKQEWTAKKLRETLEQD